MNSTLLGSTLRKRSKNDKLSNRRRILLDLDEAHPPVLKHAECAKSHGLSMGTVANIVREFNDGGLEAVLTLKRSVNSGQSRRKVDGSAEALAIAETPLRA